MGSLKDRPAGTLEDVAVDVRPSTDVLSALMPRALRGRDIVFVAPASRRSDPWMPQQHLRARLARDNRVLSVEWPPARSPRLRGSLRPWAVDGLFVVSPPGIPSRRLGAALLPGVVGRGARRLGFDAPLLWACTPDAEVLIDVLDPAQVVYHCLDPAEIAPAFARRADIVLAASPDAARRLRELTDRVLDAPSGADTASFARALADGAVDPAVADLPRPRIVVTGTISARRLDVPLLLGVAQARPGWSLVLVGPEVRGEPSGDLAALRSLPNVHVLGRRGHAALPEVLRGAEAALVALPRDRRTEATLPMQVLEHLAAGRPVVATPLPTLGGMEHVRLAADSETAVRELEAALAEDDLDARRRRSAAAARHSWDARIEEVTVALTHARRPLVAP
jgi:glycosyltransferase involved in cell wall biosynthesis